jgi:hypothetical protein
MREHDGRINTDLGAVANVWNLLGEYGVLTPSANQWLLVSLSQATPEPSTFALLSLGGGLIALVRARRRQ